MPDNSREGDVESTGASLRPVDGFPSLADFISSDPDHTSLVFKRFDKLAVRNLLYIQSELAELQAKQEQFDAEDQSIEHGSREAKECAMNWETFKARAESDEDQRKRLQLVRDIRAKMKEYREALLFESTLAALKAPPVRTFDALNHAFSRFNKSANRWDPVLGGHSATLYSTNEDLVLLKQPEQGDRFTAFAERYLSFLLISGKRENDMAYVPERRIARFVTIISIVIAVIMLIVPVATLYVVSNPTKRLVMIGIYMLLFAGSVGLFTTAKWSEVFAATAAYAAVLVVFVSGNLGSGSQTKN